MNARTIAAWLWLVAACGGRPGATDPDAGTSPDSDPADTDAGGADPDAAPADPDAGPPNAGPPTARVIFPPARGVTDAATVMVRGTAADPDGVAAIRVNGQPAQSTDGFATWRALVTLAAGANAVVVETEDSRGAIGPAAAQVEVLLRPILTLDGNATRVAVDGGRALVVDSDRLIAVDRATGTRTLISPATAGFLAVTHNGGMAADLGRGRVLVGSLDSLVAIDAGTGARSLVSGGLGSLERGAGPRLDTISGVAVGATTALVTDGDLGALVSIDLVSGERTIASSSTRGTGPALADVRGVAIAPAGNRAFVLVDRFPSRLLAIDLATGDRVDASAGSGPALGSAEDVVLDAAANRVVLVDGLRLVTIDLATGNRSVVAGSGPELATAFRLALAAQDRAIVVDIGRGVLVDVDLATGARTLLVDRDLGTGIPLSEPRAVFATPGGAVVLSRAPEAVMAVDVETGARSVLAHRDGAGPALALPIALEPGPVDGHALVLGNFDLFDVELATGARTFVSANDGFTHPMDVAYDAVLDRTFVFDEAARSIQNVNRVTGARTRFAPLDLGFPGPGQAELAIDRPRNRLLLVDDTHARLLAFDLTTGVSSIVTGSGPALQRARGIALAGDRALVVGAPGVIAVDLATGTRTLLVDATDAAGPQLADASAIGLDTVAGRALVTDPRGVYVVDLETGHRVLVSAR